MRYWSFVISHLLLAISYLLYAAPVMAQPDFATKFSTTYTVSTEGVTEVSHLIEFTNRLSQLYLTDYSLQIGSTKLKDIYASSSSGPITVTSSQKDNLTDINLSFNAPTIGKDKTFRVSLNYTNLDIAVKSGRVLEINIPVLKTFDQMDEYLITLKVPDSFPAPSLISPATKDVFHQSGSRVLRWQKDQVSPSGVSVLFGSSQLYNFTLTYTLTNPGLTKNQFLIALPPNTDRQQMLYESITPEPEKVKLDNDGNWLAEYQLKPRETINIIAVGQATIYLEPKTPTSPEPLPAYLTSSQKFWNTDDPQIMSLAQELKYPKNIYDYLVKNLKYNYQRIEQSATRLGASSALTNPDNVICTEFTDLFVALARAAGIPARAVDGYAFSANSALRPLSLKLDILHSWPEYYDYNTNRWIPIDPTWGNTTGGLDYFSRWDLNHFSFVIHGQSSITPYPAGAYKSTADTAKAVHVVVADEPLKTATINLTPQKQTNTYEPKTASLPLSYLLAASLLILAFITWRVLVSRRR